MLLSITQGLTTLLLLLITYLSIKFLLIPYYHISRYRRKGIPGYFYPFLGILKRASTHEKLHNDMLFHFKSLPKKNPNLRFEVANFIDRVCIILYEPDLIKEFYSSQTYYKKVDFAGAMKSVAGNGLALAEGQTWRNHRRIISNMFHFDFLKEKIPVLVGTTREFLREVREGSMREVNIMDEIQKITGEIVGRIFFGENLNQYKINDQPMTLYLAHLTAKSGSLFKKIDVSILAFTGLNPEWVPEYKQHMENVREFRELCLKIVQDHKNSAQPKGNDLLSLLLETQNAVNPEDRFSDEDIINEFITFFVAGMDTTGHLITMALYLLTKDPEYIDRLDKEIEEHYSQGNSVNIDSLNKMDFAHGILKETLRIYNPAPMIFPRLAQEDHELLDIKVKKGMSVIPRPLYNCYNEKYFEEPDKFKPERWIGKKEVSLAFIDIPFSAGPRNCIGQHLAMVEAKIILAEFVKTFRFKVVPEDYELVMTWSFLYEPKKEILMDLDPK